MRESPPNVYEMTSVLGPDELNQSFKSFTESRTNMVASVETLDTKTIATKRVYSEFIVAHSTHGTFGIDSYGFANKLHKLQFDTICEMKRLIDNRIYGEFYKLRKMMIEFATQHIVGDVNAERLAERLAEISAKSAKYPKFKDIVDGETLYCFNMTSDIFADIVSLLRLLMSHMEARAKQLADSEARTKKGMNIHNLVSAYRYETNVLSEKISLYSRYAETFVSYHTKYVVRVAEKITALDSQIVTDAVDVGG